MSMADKNVTPGSPPINQSDDKAHADSILTKSDPSTNVVLPSSVTTSSLDEVRTSEIEGNVTLPTPAQRAPEGEGQTQESIEPDGYQPQTLDASSEMV